MLQRKGTKRNQPTLKMLLSMLSFPIVSENIQGKDLTRNTTQPKALHLRHFSIDNEKHMLALYQSIGHFINQSISTTSPMHER
jgi:hypothetical protein